MGDPPITGTVPVERGGTEPFVREKGAHPSVPWLALGWIARNAAHLVASTFATQDIDGRDWMAPDPPRELLDRVAIVLGARTGVATLTEALDRDLWIDYVADTGDDDEVSRAVAQLVSRAYELDEPESGHRFVAPRGDLLIFGGDTAYPVATAQEIRNRLVEPWNGVLRSRPEAGGRVVLGIPGNHDWNDGLDGFGRLFRRRDPLPVGDRPNADGPLALHGYEAVQNASYFALPIAPGVDIWGVDRQLGHVDHRQRQFFARVRGDDGAGARVLLQSDPHRVFCRDNPPGQDIARRLSLDLGAEPHLVLSGDIHQYQRWREGPTLHVTAGGGGAALHGAALGSRRQPPAPEAEFPGERDSRPLLRGAFARIATGRAGWLVHSAIGLVGLVVGGTGAAVADGPGLVAAGLLLGIVALFGGMRAFTREAFGESALLGLGIGAPLVAMGWHMPESLRLIGDVVPVVLAAAGAALVGGTVAAFAIYSLARRGVDDYLAWAALAHPGFKHFVRLRVRRDGSTVDGWCLALRNPCAKGEPVLCADRFTWSTR